MNEVNWVKFFNILKVENPREYYTLLSELVKEEEKSQKQLKEAFKNIGYAID